MFNYRCDGCGVHLRGICMQCKQELLRAPQPTVLGVLAAVSFEGAARQLVHGLKFHNHQAVAALFAEVMINRLPHDFEEPALVTWAPTSVQRKHVRGHDQAELIARSFAHQLRIPCRQVLRRTSTQPQAGLSREDRLAGPSFIARSCVGFGHIFVIDDVVTTGSTLARASLALSRAGALRVTCGAFAATPAPALRR